MDIMGNMDTGKWDLTRVLTSVALLDTWPLFKFKQVSKQFVLRSPDPIEFVAGLKAGDTNNLKYRKAAGRITAVLEQVMNGAKAGSKKVNAILDLMIRLQMIPKKSDSPRAEMISLNNISKTLIPTINLTAMFEKLASPHPISGDEMMVVPQKTYIAQLNQPFLKNYLATNKGALNDFIWFIYLYNNMDILVPKDYGNGAPPTRPITIKTCLLKLQEDEFPSLRLVTEALYLRKYLPSRINEKDDVEDMIDRILRAFLVNAKTHSWIDGPTRKQIQAKVDNMGKDALYPDVLMDDKLFNELYQNLNTTKDNYFDNLMSIAKWSVKEKFASYLQSKEPVGWKQSIDTTNAFYQAPNNRFMILTAMSNIPNYDVGVPNYLNYGGLGSIIGHELTHGFDTNGILYDKNGKKGKWWTNSSTEEFHKRTQCFIDQFDQLTQTLVNGGVLTVNGTLTLGENIADGGGLISSFTAWKQLVKEKGADQLLPSLPDEYTAERLFFISFAQSACAKTGVTQLKKLYKTGHHTQAYPRVNGIVMNSEDFANAYGCKSGTPMNPEKKCRIW